jgi:hypothetical protein
MNGTTFAASAPPPPALLRVEVGNNTITRVPQGQRLAEPTCGAQPASCSCTYVAQYSSWQGRPGKLAERRARPFHSTRAGSEQAVHKLFSEPTSPPPHTPRMPSTGPQSGQEFPIFVGIT